MTTLERVAGSLRTLWDGLGRNKDQITIVFAVLAAGWGLLEYRDRLLAGQRAETLRFVERYHGDHYLQARQALHRVAFDRALQKEYLAVRLDPQKLEVFVTEQGLTPHLLILAEVYDSLARCVDAGICSQDAACAQFSGDIEGLRNAYRALFTATWKEMWGEDFMARSTALLQACKASR